MMSHLDYDIRQAMRLGYGVRYGAYKADHPNTRYDDPAEINDFIRCDHCGEKIYHPRHNQRFCCSACQNRAGALRYYQKKKEERAIETMAE